MNLIVSILYAPLVFMLYRYYDINTISLIVLVASIVWFFLTLKQEKKERIYPLLYIVFSIASFFIEEFIILKSMPLTISIIFTIIILISYINKSSIILYFVKRFFKKEVSNLEQEYIHKSTLFWVGICSINVGIHIFILFYEDLKYWMYYSSFGWYILFLFAGVIQFLHRKFIFGRKYD